MRITLACGEGFRRWNSKKVSWNFALPNNGRVSQERAENFLGPQSHPVCDGRNRG